jgi:signal transduction histidine kinase
MSRLTLAARIGLIMLIGLTCVWIALTAIYFRGHGLDAEGTRPAPARLAALTALVETTPASERPRLFAALDSDLFAARIETAPPSPSTPLEPRLQALYAAALPGRSLAITAPAPPGGTRLFARLYANPRNALEFRIGLGTGETLVVDARNPVLVTAAGLPVGFGAGLFGTVVALGALLIMLRETRPLTRLAAAVDRIDLSGEPVPVPEPSRSAPEIQALGRAFNRLQDRLAGLLKARMAMLGGISHDVRTFATRLRLRVDLITDDEERERAIADIADMIRLLDDALLASRAGVGELTQELVELDEILRSDIADRQAHGAPVTLSIAAEAAGAALLGDRLALRRITANLIDNALKYGHRAEVSLAVAAGGLMLQVDDDGPGIPEAQRGLLLEPFVRLETSRNRRTGGAGLGLAVVRSLAEAQGGSVEIGTSALGGARLIVRLPRFEPA